MGASNHAFARTPTPTLFVESQPLHSGPRYRLVKTIERDHVIANYRVLWDGYDLVELRSLGASRRLRLPWWNSDIGGTGSKAVIRFERMKNNKWIECEDPRDVAAQNAR